MWSQCVTCRNGRSSPTAISSASGKIIVTFNLAADLKRKQSTEREMIS